MSEISKLSLISEFISGVAGTEKACLFLGAGADVSSGGVLFKDIKKDIISYSQNRQIHDFEAQDVIDRNFDEIIESLDEETRCLVIDRFIKRSEKWVPSDGYELLVLLAKENCISSVITTNFANLLETTQEMLQANAFQIFSPATAIPSKSIMVSNSKKPIYLKMHGDLDGRLVTHLTSSEIIGKEYHEAFVSLMRFLIQDRTIVFLGYSGWDKKIADIFKTVSNIKRVYWCNISEPDKNAPLIKVFNEKGVHINYIQHNFDEILQSISVEYFKDKTLFSSDLIFIWSLIKAKSERILSNFQKVVLEQNNEYKLVQRSKLYLFYDFIIEDKYFCAITGDTGKGKSIFVSQLCTDYKSNKDIWPIPIDVSKTSCDTILNQIINNLGYSSKDPFNVLCQFTRWASEQKKIFVYIIDNIDKNRRETNEVAKIVNELLELSYTVRKYRSAKFIVTLRTDTWNKIVSLLDKNYLNSILWKDRNNEISNTFRLETFDDAELKIAKRNILSLIPDSAIPDGIDQLINEPVVYGLIQKNTAVLRRVQRFDIYSIFESLFFSGIYRSILEQCAYSELNDYIHDSNVQRITKVQIEYISQNINLHHYLSITSKGIHFKNDVFLECCLASYLSSNNYLYTHFKSATGFYETYLGLKLSKPVYYGIVRYLGAICNDFSSLIKLISSLLKSYPDDKIVSKFINETFRYSAEYNVVEYVNNLKSFDPHRVEFDALVPYFINSIGFMNDNYAFETLDHFHKTASYPYELECTALINDRFTMGIRKDKQPLKYKEYYNQYKKYILNDRNPLLSLFSLLWVMGRIGKDNTPEVLYENIAGLIASQINLLEYNGNIDQLKEVTDKFKDNAYFIFFNSDNNIEEKIKMYSQKSNAIPIIKSLTVQKRFTQKDILNIKALVNHLNDPVDFFVCNLLFVYLGDMDFSSAIEALDMLYLSFDSDTDVTELDFYSSVLFITHYINNPVDRNMYLERYKRMVTDFEYKMFISPSMQREASFRRFKDKFEIEFEDGFNILTDYTYTAPLCNYISSENQSVDSYLQLFWELLEILEQQGLHDEMIRLIQAINQMSVNWPEEALCALSKFSKYSYSIIRRAVVTTLKENYLRYPKITQKYLQHAEELFSEQELLEIFSAKDSQIENRTLEQLQWARSLYFIKNYIDPHIAEHFLSIISSADSLMEIFEKLVRILLDLSSQ